MPYIVKTARAQMPSSCWGRYRRVAVIEVEPGIADVAMISPRARGVVRIVATWERLSEGKTERCAFRRALAEARQLVKEMEG